MLLVFCFPLSREDNEILGKVRLLYELGIIGFSFSPDEIKSKSIGCPLCFAFNEGMYPFNRIKGYILKEKENIKILLNPIFVKRLSLCYNITEIVDVYNWNYLKDNHTRKKGIDRL